MISISEAVQSKINNSPFLAHALCSQLLNINELARFWHDDIAAATKKTVSTAAIAMSIRRYLTDLSHQLPSQKILAPTQITARHNLIEKTYQNSMSLHKAYRTFLELSENNSVPFILRTTGVHETTIIINQELYPLLNTVFVKENSLVEIDNLAALILLLPPNVIETPGCYYSYLGVLALAGINLTEVVSTTHELILILSEKDISHSFNLLSRANASAF
jgi:aspartokinase